MKICGIYKIISPSNRIYIGQSIDCNARKIQYSNANCNHQKKLLNSIIKYGWINHKFEIIKECERDELNKWEKYYVDLFNTFNTKHGLNCRDGGGCKGFLSEEQKIKISNSLKGVKHTKERIEKNRLANTGKKLTEETKRKISMNNTKPNLGKKASLETRLKQSLTKKGKTTWIKGKHHSEETRLKLSVLNSGENHRDYGKPKSQEHKDKVSKKLMGHTVSEETRNKISLKNIGRKLSPETIAKRESTRKENDIKFSRRNYNI